MSLRGSRKKVAESVLEAAEAEVPGVRQAQRERTRRAILDSAAKVFAEAGFDGADMRTIADRADVNHGLLHYHFSSKLRLWKACVDDLNELAAATPMLDDDGNVLDTKDLDGREPEFLNAIIRNYVHYAVEHPEWARILVDATRAPGQRLDYIVDKYQKPRAKAMQDFIRHLQDSGHLPKVSPMVLQYMLWGMANTLFSMSAEVKRKTGVDPTKDQSLIDEQIRAMQLLFSGAAPAPARKNARKG